jgi:pilus assembly protein CpaE
LRGRPSADLDEGLMSEEEKQPSEQSERPTAGQELQAELAPLLDEIVSKSLDEERELRHQVIADLREARLKRDSDKQAKPWWQRKATVWLPDSWLPPDWTSRSQATPSRGRTTDNAAAVTKSFPPSSTAPPLISRLLARKGLRAAVVSPDQASRDELRACLDETGWVNSVEEWPGPNENQLHADQDVSDVILLDLLPDLETSLRFAAQLRKLRPGTCVIACFQSQPDSEMVLQAMRAGIQEVLHKPLNPDVLKGVLARAIQKWGELVESRPKKTKKLMLVMGSKGGVGTSTVAVNLGVQLAQMTKKRVGLLDFAHPWGQVALLLDLQPRFTIFDAVENQERLDAQLFSELLTRHDSGLDVLAGISSAQKGQQISGHALGRVLNEAQNQFDYLLIDGGGINWSHCTSILDFGPTVLLVAGIYVPDFWALERHLMALLAHGVDPEHVRVVINRWHSCDEEALRSVEKILKHPIFARVPDDYQHVSQAVNSGVPLSKDYGEHLELSIQEMACHLVGMAPPAGARRSALPRLFSSIK